MVYGKDKLPGLSGQGRRVSAVTVLVGLVMLLVPALAYMQYQWLGQLSTAERERMQRTLRTAAAQFATEFDTELSRALVSLQVDGPAIRDDNWTGYAQRYSAWTNSATEPRLVREVLLVDAVPGTDLPELGSQTALTVDQLRLRRWNPQSLTFDATNWSDDLAGLRTSLATHFIGFQVERTRPQGNGGGGSERIRRDGTLSISLGDDNTLVAPVTLFELPDSRRGPPRITVLGFTVVRLDPVVVRDTLLASLAARHFHGNDEEVDYRVAVVHKDDEKKVVWESEPGVAERISASPDVTQTFMGPRPDQMFVFARGVNGAPPPAPPAPPEPPAGSSTSATTIRIEPPAGDPTARLRTENLVVSMVERETRAAGGARVITRTGQFNPFEGRWTLMAKHRAGSLEAAVAAVRQRNLVVSSSVLLLLTLAVGLIVVSARRAQELARQQMEFVAAVSHELRTPVSVIGAAAGNLADGVVGDPARVRKYGETIQGEARRLAETVERVLQLAGIAAGRAAAARTTVQPADLVHDSVGACRTEIENAGARVEVEIAPNLPPVIGDVTALRSALQNLISNAVKYGGDARWVRVSASRSGVGNRESGVGGKNVVFTVEDRGLGIDADDRKHIFEPFYRGREAVSKQIQGSGLGLNLVARIAEAHGGKVSVTSEPGKGSAFTISLPAVTDRAAAESQAAFAAGLETSRS